MFWRNDGVDDRMDDDDMLEMEDLWNVNLKIVGGP